MCDFTVCVSEHWCHSHMKPTYAHIESVQEATHLELFSDSLWQVVVQEEVGLLLLYLHSLSQHEFIPHVELAAVCGDQVANDTDQHEEDVLRAGATKQGLEQRHKEEEMG